MFTHGILIGKFYPFHKGHADLIRFAMMSCSSLDIVVCPTFHAVFPTEQRMMWIQGYINQMTGLISGNSEHIHVRTIEPGLPDLPEDDPMFWQKWQQALKPFCGRSGDRLVVFAGEEYGADLAEKLGGTFMPYPRELRPISGTWCRSSIDAWDQFPDITKMGTLSMYAFVGPESTGKTAVSKAVAEALGTKIATWYPEYARGFLDQHGVEITKQKLIDIYRGQSAMQSAVLLDPRSPVLLFDTDLLTTVGWISYFGYTDQLPRAMQIEIADDFNHEVWSTIHYFLMSDEDVPFVPDPQRYGGDKRQTSTTYWSELVGKSGRQVTVLKGTFDERVSKAIDIINDSAFPWLTNREDLV